MSSVSLSGNASGSGALTIATPNTNSNYTFTLPAETGTALTSNAPGYNAFKNRIINGAMVIDQRNAGAAQTITAAAALAYTVDRWYGYCTGANVTGQQVAGSGAIQNRYRFTGAASVTAVGFGQRIEQKNSYDLAGSTATLSADLAISATLTTVTWTASYATTTADTFGTLASPTVTQIATGTFTVTSTVTNFSTNITIPAAATTGIQIVFTVGALTAGLTWTVGNVQLEKGSTATSFDYRPYGTELALCQRYLPAWRASSASDPIATGNQFSTTIPITNFVFPVETRSPATGIIVSNGSHFQWNGGNGATATLSMTFSLSSTKMGQVNGAITASGAIGYSGTLFISNASGFIYFTGCEL